MTGEIMDLNLNTMSMSELRRLQSKVNTEMQRRNDTARRDFVKKLKKMASDEGLSLSDVIEDIAQTESREAAPARKRKAKTKSSEKKTGKLPLKYHHPENPGIGWSGHGRRPQWIIDWLAQDKPLETLETPAGN
jgi:DNA-binding protein H-NS